MPGPFVFEYIQNLMMSVAPYAPLYVPYTNEQGAFNNIIGYSRKFAELFKFREDINPNEIVNVIFKRND